MNERTEAILVELLRQERFGRVLGTQCWAEGYCARLASELDGNVANFWPRKDVHGGCDLNRCPLYFDNIHSRRTQPLYGAGWHEGWAEGERWLDDLDWRLAHGVCEVCGEPLTGKHTQRYCSAACRQKAYRERNGKKCNTREEA